MVIARYACGEKDDLAIAHKAGALYTLLKVTRVSNEEFRVEPDGDDYRSLGGQPW